MFGQPPLVSVIEDASTPTSEALLRAEKYSYSRITKPLQDSPTRGVNGLMPLRNSQSMALFSFGGSAYRTELPSNAAQSPADTLNPSLTLQYSSSAHAFSFDANRPPYTLVPLDTGLFTSLKDSQRLTMTKCLGLALLPTGELLALIDIPSQIMIMISPGVWVPYVTDQAKFSFGQRWHPLRTSLQNATSIAVSGDITYIADSQQGSTLLITYQGKQETQVSLNLQMGRNFRAVFPAAKPNSFLVVESTGAVIYITHTLSFENDRISAVPTFKQLTGSVGWVGSVSAAAISPEGDILVASQYKTILYERRNHYRAIDLYGLTESVTALLFTSTGDLVVLQVVSTAAKRRISLISRSVLRTFTAATKAPLPTLWSMDFDIKSSQDPQAPFRGAVDRSIESIIATPAGELIVCAGFSIIWFASNHTHTEPPTAQNFSLSSLASPTSVSFSMLRNISPDTSNAYSIAQGTFNVASVAFSVPFVPSYLVIRCLKLFAQRAALEATTVFSHRAFSALFAYIYDNTVIPPTDLPTTTPQEAAQFYAELATLASSLELSSLEKYAEFRLFTLLQSDQTLGAGLLSVLMKLKDSSFSAPDPSLLVKTCQFLATQPDATVNDLIDVLVDQFSSNPSFLKLALKVSVIPGAYPPITPYCDPTTDLSLQLSNAFCLELKGGDWRVKTSAPNYCLHGVLCHSSVLFARWRYFRESIFPHHPTSFDFTEPSAHETVAVKALLRFIYTGSVSHLNTSPINTALFADSSAFQLLKEPFFEELLETSVGLSHATPKQILAEFRSAIEQSRDHMQLHKLRISVAEHLPAILKDCPEDFARLSPEEQYALLMIEVYLAHPSTTSKPTIKSDTPASFGFGNGSTASSN